MAGPGNSFIPGKDPKAQNHQQAFNTLQRKASAPIQGFHAFLNANSDGSGNIYFTVDTISPSSAQQFFNLAASPNPTFLRFPTNGFWSVFAVGTVLSTATVNVGITPVRCGLENVIAYWNNAGTIINGINASFPCNVSNPANTFSYLYLSGNSSIPNLAYLGTLELVVYLNGPAFNFAKAGIN